MKLRINKNSLRLRLTQSDVDQIAQGLPVLERLEFPGPSENELVYSLYPTKENSNFSVNFSRNEILIQIPEKVAKVWAKSDKVGLCENLEINKGASMSLHIEKDFQCLHKRTGEDESDNFPHPAMNTQNSSKKTEV